MKWMHKVKSCPFCGGKIIVIKSPIGILLFKCRQCGCIVSFGNDHYNSHPEKAIEAFNRRETACKEFQTGDMS